MTVSCNEMILKEPLRISARLLPAVKIGDSWLSFNPDTEVFHLDTPDFYKASCGLKARTTVPMLRQFQGMLSFMAAAAEAQRAVDQGRFSDNSDIFEPDLMQWCQENASEIEAMLCELEV